MINFKISKISLSILFFALISVNKSAAQVPSPYARVIEIKVKPNYLEEFKAALKEDMQTAVKNEKGIVALYAVYDNDVSNHVTVFEVFINKEAHKMHQSTPNFEKYKSKTTEMVLSTERREVIPIFLNGK